MVLGFDITLELDGFLMALYILADSFYIRVVYRLINRLKLKPALKCNSKVGGKIESKFSNRFLEHNQVANHRESENKSFVIPLNDEERD